MTVTRQTPPILCVLDDYRTARKISVFSTLDTTPKQREQPTPRLCFTRSTPVGLVLIRLGCIVYLPSPRTLRTLQATHTSVMCKFIIVQLKLSHPVSPVPHKALRSRSLLAPFFLVLPFYVWLSVFQVLYLVLEHNARLVCNTHRTFHLVCVRSFRRVVVLLEIHNYIHDDWSITTDVVVSLFIVSIATRMLVTKIYLVLLKVLCLPTDNAQVLSRGSSFYRVRSNGARLNIVSFLSHLTEKTVHESMRVLVRKAPLACVDT